MTLGNFNGKNIRSECFFSGDLMRITGGFLIYGLKNGNPIFSLLINFNSG